MDFADPRLVEKFGSWVRVQVEFYDFLFQHGTELDPKEWKQEASSGFGGFANGKDFYENSVKGIEARFPTVGEAWEHFVDREKANA